MLVLTRKPGEAIVIGNEIVITVIEARSGQVRIGIDAPRHIAVHRHEVYEQVRRENLAAIADAKDAAGLIRSRNPDRRRDSGR
jgi:carbon storage regulator